MYATNKTRSAVQAAIGSRDLGQVAESLLCFVPQEFLAEYENGADEFLFGPAHFQQRLVQISVEDPTLVYDDETGKITDVQFKLRVFGIMHEGQLQPLQQGRSIGYALQGYRSQPLSTRKLVEAKVLPETAKEVMKSYAFMWQDMGDQAYVGENAKKRVYVTVEGIGGIKFQYELRPIPDSNECALGIHVTGAKNLSLLGFGVKREAAGVSDDISVQTSSGGARRKLSVDYSNVPAKAPRKQIGVAANQIADYGNLGW